MTKRLCAVIFTVVVLIHPVSSDAQDRSFKATTGMMLNYIKPAKTADFEQVMNQVAKALATSSKPEHKAMAEGWHLLRAHEPGPNNSVLYVWWIDPVPQSADFLISKILNEYYPEQVQALYGRYNDAFAGGQAMVNLDRVMHLAEPLEDEVGEPAGSAGAPSDIPADVLATIRAKCTDDWPDDFSMRAYCEKQQFEGYRAVR